MRETSPSSWSRREFLKRAGGLLVGVAAAEALGPLEHLKAQETPLHRDAIEVPATTAPTTGKSREHKEQQTQLPQATELYAITLSPEQNQGVLEQLTTWGKEIAAKEGDPSVRVFRVPVDYDRNAIHNPRDYKLPLMVNPSTGQPYSTELSYLLGGLPREFTQGGLIDSVYTGQALPNGQENWSVLFQVRQANKVFGMKAGALLFMDKSTRVTDPNKPVNIVNMDNNVEGLTLTTTIATDYFLNGARWANPEVFQNVQPGDQIVVYTDSDNYVRRLVVGTPDTGISIVTFRDDIQSPQPGGTQETTTLTGEKVPLTVTAVPLPSGAKTPGSAGTDLTRYQTTPEALASAGKARALSSKELSGNFASGIEVKFADGRKFTIKTNLSSFVYTDYVKVALFRDELQQLGILDLHKKNFEVILADADKRTFGFASSWFEYWNGKDQAHAWDGYGFVDKVTDMGDHKQYVVYVDKRTIEATKTDTRRFMLQSLGNALAFQAIVYHQTGAMGMMPKLDQVMHTVEQNPFKLEYR